jgi:ubiquinone biosynthesis protein UbiJ
MLLALGQRMLNEQIRASTAARECLRSLDGRRFAVTVKGSDLRIVIEASGNELLLRSSPDGECDVELCAGAFDLLRLARSAGLSDLKSTGATLNGDVNVAEGFADLLRLAMPEPEAVLAEWVGDIPAHAAGEAARRLGGWSRRAGRAFEQNLAEYLQEERPTLVPPALARHYLAEVDRLRDDVERAERRIVLLERRFGQRTA